MDLSNFGNHVRRRRNELGLTQKKLADKVGLSESEVSRIETAKVDDIEASTLYGLAKALRWDAYQMQQAYEGKWPDGTIRNIPDPLKDTIKDFVRALPKDLLDELQF